MGIKSMGTKRLPTDLPIGLCSDGGRRAPFAPSGRMNRGYSGSRLMGRRRKGDEDLMAAVDHVNAEPGKGPSNSRPPGFQKSKSGPWSGRRSLRATRYAGMS